MIDIHSHIIFGVDDGPSNLDDSLRMLYEAEKVGIKTIIATPHIKYSLSEIERVEENFFILLEKSCNFNLQIKKGFEVFINFFVPDTIYREKILTLDDSLLQLVEFPVSEAAPYARETIYRMQLNLLTPVIAHPERCAVFKNELSVLYSYLELGCMSQVDMSSIIGHFGKSSRNYAKKMLKNGCVDFVASDAHCAEDYSKRFTRAYEIVVRWIGKEGADRVYRKNAAEVFFPTNNSDNNVNLQNII